MTHPLDAANVPSPVDLKNADTIIGRASKFVGTYVDEQMRGQLNTYAYGSGSRVWLVGHGRVWKDGRGHRVYKQTSVDYGDWSALDAKLTEAKAHYEKVRNG